MADSALFRRNAAAAALVTGPVLAVASQFLYQPGAGPNQPGPMLQALEGAHGRATASTLLFVVFQLPSMIGALAIGHVLRSRFPRLSSWGATMAVAGAFCEAVASTFFLVYAQLAHDAAHRQDYLGIVKQSGDIEGIFSLAGLAGTVLGVLLLSIGLFRSHIGPRWVAPLLWAFLLLQFAGSGLSSSFDLVSVTLALIAYWALAVTVWQSPAEAWDIAVPFQRAASVALQPTSA